MSVYAIGYSTNKKSFLELGAAQIESECGHTSYYASNIGDKQKITGIIKGFSYIIENTDIITFTTKLSVIEEFFRLSKELSSKTKMHYSEIEILQAKISSLESDISSDQVDTLIECENLIETIQKDKLKELLSEKHSIA